MERMMKELGIMGIADWRVTVRTASAAKSAMSLVTVAFAKGAGTRRSLLTMFIDPCEMA